MDVQTQEIIEACVAGSQAGTRSFGEVVGALVGCGIESYRVDYRQGAATYFLPSEASHTVTFGGHEGAIADGFDHDAVVEAIRGAQSGVVKYPEFVRRTMQAGCVGYVVWIVGRHVVYFGRRGESHVEHFPPAPR